MASVALGATAAGGGDKDVILPPDAAARAYEAGRSLVKRGRYLNCPNGSHLALYDDQKTYFDGLIRFIRDVDGGKF